jgi:protein involved in polysaccharide export with SLBB domain
LLTALLIAGCKTPSSNLSSSAPSKAAAANPLSPDILRVGDQLSVVFSDIPGVSQTVVEDRIKEDGTVTLLLNQQFTAAGKTRGELEKEVLKRYVPDCYLRLTILVRPRESTIPWH